MGRARRAAALFVSSGEPWHSERIGLAELRQLWPRLKIRGREAGVGWRLWGTSKGGEQGDKGESEARRVKEFQASESILFRFPPKSHSCQGSDRCCD